MRVRVAMLAGEDGRVKRVCVCGRCEEMGGARRTEGDAEGTVGANREDRIGVPTDTGADREVEFTARADATFANNATCANSAVRANLAKCAGRATSAGSAMCTGDAMCAGIARSAPFA